MRRRLVISTLAIVLVVLAALAIPIGLIVYDAAEQQLETRLELQANSIADTLAQLEALGRRYRVRQSYGEGHAYAIPLSGSGTEAAVSSFTRDDLVRFHETWFKVEF